MGTRIGIAMAEPAAPAGAFGLGPTTGKEPGADAPSPASERG
jgi:hypothetical protein